MRYTLYVDESGDLGLDKVRGDWMSRGSSPFMVLGACLMPQSKRDEICGIHDEVAERLGKVSLHCSEINHAQVAYFARMVSVKARVKLFALVSKKDTLKSYKDQISGKNQAQYYYNKCAQLLLERVGDFLRANSIPKDSLSIVFEERSGHDYGKLRNYIRSAIQDHFDERTHKYLSHIDPLSITAAGKDSDRLLSLADLTAYSVYQAVNFSASNYGMGEQRYLRELAAKFYKDEKTGRIGDVGLKMMMWRSMGLDASSRRYFEKLHGIVPKETQK